MESAVRTCLQKYATFSGRAARPELWWWVLAVFLGGIACNIVDFLLFGESEAVSTLFSLAVLLPHLAVGARRLHDIDRSGWWLLVGFVPLVGWIVLLVFFVQDGTVGPNRYGPDPKGRSLDDLGPQPDPEPTF